MNKRYKLLTLILPCALVPFTGLLAQEADDEDVIELSPFVVTGNDDIGYQATSTLAGTRLKSNLSDIATSISIVNEEFLNDTASNNIADVLVLTPNTEVAGLAGNFSATQYAGTGNPIPEGNRDSQSGGFTRIRGLSEADLTRDYFVTDVPFDSFNTSRVAVQRGANSALFGLGSPGGIVNNTTIKADYLGNRGQIKLATDEYGTKRGSFRYNAEIIDDRLAILVAGLSLDQQYEQKEAFEEDERLYASLTFNILPNIRVHVSGETGERDSARPDFIPPNDGITPWILAGKPIAENPEHAAELIRGSGDFFPAAADGGQNRNSRLLTWDTAGASSGFVEYFHNVGSPYATFGGTPLVRNGQGTPGDAWYGQMRVRPMIRTMTLTGGWWPGGGTVAPGTASFYSTGNVDLQLLDRSIYDYRKHLFSGGSSTQGSDWDIIQGTIEGTFLDNMVGFEVAAYKQDMNTWGFNALQGIEQRTIYIDANKYLIAPDPNGGWVPNPAFGKPTMGGGYGGNWLRSDRESWRATAFIDIDAKDFLKEESWLTKLLGRFKGTGVYQERSGDGESNYGGRGGIDAQTTADALFGGDIHKYSWSYANYYKGMQFTLPSSANVNFLTANSLNDVRGANIGAVPYGSKRTKFQSPQTFIGWDSESEQFVNFTTPVYTLRDLKGDGATQVSFYSGKGKTEIDSKVLVGQWFLWEDLVVLTGTWRNDVQRSGSVGAPRWDPYGDGRGLNQHEDVNDPEYKAGVKNLSEDADEDTTSWGIVIHSPDFINEMLPWGTQLSIYKSKADNFQPSGGRVNIYNQQIDPVTGATEEWGFIVSTLDGKLNARFNWFETGILNNSFDVGGVSNSEGILRGLVEQLANPANIAQGFTAADSQAALPPQGVLDVNGFNPNWQDFTVEMDRDSGDSGTQDFTSEGMEVEISYNPTPNWTILLTVAEQETVTSNTYPVLTRYVNDFVIPEWVNSSFAQNFFIDLDAQTTLADQAQRTIVDPVQQAVASDGVPSIEQRKWRWSVNTSYNFGRNSDLIPDFLGNLTIGGGVRWEDKVGIGFGVAVNEFGNMALDTDQPFYGPSQTFVDVFARTEYELSSKTSLILQVNIKDLMDNADLVPFYAEPNGMKLYRFLQGRLITASATVKF